MTTLNDDIAAFLEAHNMRPSTFGRKAIGDWKLVKELRGDNRAKPRRLWPDTEAQIRRFMVTYKAEGSQ